MANAIGKAKYPLSSMSPTIVLNEDGSPFLAVGSPGGATIIVADLNEELAQSVAAEMGEHAWAVKVNVGDTVSKGQTVVVLEAMKMENNINTDRDGKITAIQVAKGDTVADGAVLVVLE